MCTKFQTSVYLGGNKAEITNLETVFLNMDVFERGKRMCFLCKMRQKLCMCALV